MKKEGSGGPAGRIRRRELRAARPWKSLFVKWKSEKTYGEKMTYRHFCLDNVQF